MNGDPSGPTAVASSPSYIFLAQRYAFLLTSPSVCLPPCVPPLTRMGTAMGQGGAGKFGTERRVFGLDSDSTPGPGAYDHLEAFKVRVVCC